MTEQELSSIFDSPSAAIVAPAGHGKTEMIVDIVEYAQGKQKQLLLTHTNAGVEALGKRLKKRNVPKSKYAISTIAAFCIKWCSAYSNSAAFDKTLSPYNGGDESGKYYNQAYKGAKRIFENNWAGDILRATYTGIIVDEYQDCIQEQHEIVLAMNKFLPVRVLGDPMQGIFSFAGKLVDWQNLEFQSFEIETKPWRWSSTNPALGEYLVEIRKQLLPTLAGKPCNVRLKPHASVDIISPPSKGESPVRSSILKEYSSVVYITHPEPKQLNFCNRMRGQFQHDEKQDCSELFDYAKKFGSQVGTELALSSINFLNECATQVNNELKSYKINLEKQRFDFSRISKHNDFGSLLVSLCQDSSIDTLISVLSWLKSQKNFFKIYRKELYEEMLRSLKYACSTKTTVLEAAHRIRKDVFLQKRYSHFKWLASRTVLSKGLEFDCVIIDMKASFSAKDFYVAMTRAMKKIFIISNTADFNFKN